MKHIRLCSLILLVTVLVLFVSCSDEDDFISVNATITAHRGYHLKYKENSLDAFREAVKYGCEWAELDVWCTKDGKLVVTHDKNLKRVWNIDKNVTDYSLAELRKEIDSDKLPEFSDVWNAVKGKIKIQIEIKDPNAVAPVVEFFKANKCYSNCMVISFDGNSLQNVKTSDTNIVCGYLSNTYKAEMLNYSWADVLALNYHAVTQPIVESVHAKGKEIYVWTVDLKEEIARMDQMGVDAITTNYPQYTL